MIEIFLPGILALLAFASGMAGGFGTIFELQSGVIERFRVTPASRFAILMGPLLSGMLMMFVFDAVVVAAAGGFGFSINWLGLATLVVLLGLFMVTMSAFSVGHRPRDQGHQQFRRHHQRAEPAGSPPRRGAAPDLPRAALDAGTGPFQPAVLRRRGGPGPSVGASSNPAVWQAFAVLVPLAWWS